MNSKRILAGFLLTAAFAQTQASTQSFNFDNRSSHDIYVWVTANAHVEVPSVAALPTKVLDIKPNSSVRLNFNYTYAWNAKTILTVKFCSINSQSCLDAVGEYSSFSMIPDSLTSATWRITGTWSGLVFPYEIKDNIFELDRQKWARDTNFPITIAFFDAHKKLRYK